MAAKTITVECRGCLKPVVLQLLPEYKYGAPQVFCLECYERLNLEQYNVPPESSDQSPDATP